MFPSVGLYTSNLYLISTRSSTSFESYNLELFSCETHEVHILLKGFIVVRVRLLKTLDNRDAYVEYFILLQFL